MATEQPDLHTADGPPPPGRVPEPTGARAVLPAFALVVLVLLIISLVLFGGWVALGVAVALMLAGVFVLTRYVERIACTRPSGNQLRRGLKGMHEDLSVTDEAHKELAAVDLPLDNPARHELVRHRRDHGRGRGLSGQRARKHSAC